MQQWNEVGRVFRLTSCTARCAPALPPSQTLPVIDKRCYLQYAAGVWEWGGGFEGGDGEGTKQEKKRKNKTLNCGVASSGNEGKCKESVEEVAQI